MRTCVIVNPAAGNGRVERIWPQLRSPLEDATDHLAVRWTTAPQRATMLTRTALRDGFERIIALGGDGTLHEVVNGFFGTDGTPIQPTAVLAPLLCGTGTDFRRALHLPDPAGAIAALRTRRIRPIDLLRITYESTQDDHAVDYVINVASFGLSSRVVQFVKRPGVHLPGARLRYFGAILRALAHHEPTRVDLQLDGKRLPVDRIRLVAVANGPSFGAGIHIAPHARVDDGELDVTVIRDVSAFRLLSHARRFYAGTHETIDGVTTHRGRCLQVRVSSTSPVRMEADGELVGPLPATIEVAPSCLRIQY